MIRGRVVALVATALFALPGCVPPPPEDMAAAATPDAVDRARESVLRIRSTGPCGSGVGSGFVIRGGRVVTNHHVVAGARRVQLETWDGKPVASGRVRVATDTDLAVIDLPPAAARRVEPLPLARGRLEPGDRLVALGYANAGPAATTRGQLYDRAPGARFEESGPVLRMGTSVQPGNSGGPLLDDEARVVGVVFAYEIATLHSLAIPRERLQAVLAGTDTLRPLQPCG
jgi:S1-C subfamily serine protease